MNALHQIICDTIRAEGPISLARYMDLALQHPVHGYYRHKDRLGSSGDFITAPEISQMFGEMIGLWCADVWRQMGQPDPFVLLEMGPGRGTLMADALRATRKVEGFHKAMRLHLLESSETFRALQLEKLGDYAPVPIDDPAQVPVLPLIVIANEFFDALPVHQLLEVVVSGKKVWVERKVAVNDDNDDLFFIADPALPQGITQSEQVREASPLSLAVMQNLSTAVVERGGALLVIDYGYVAPSGCGTVQAVSGHKRADPLERPGEVDITAHVDFEALAVKARAQKAKVLPAIGQGAFLMNMGIDIRASLLRRNATPEQADAIDKALYRLVDDAEMGSLFKVMAVLSPFLQNTPGFP